MSAETCNYGIHNHQKKIALINDFTGFGRCSITVQQPVISVMGIQCCPIPTAIFSNHTGFSRFFRTDYTPYIQQYIEEWKELHLQFQGISTGFLGSAEQITLVKQFLTEFKTEKTVVIVDPVMGDYGRLYYSFSEELAARMHELLPFADVLLPNLTEACILTNTPYRTNFTEKELFPICEALAASGPSRIAISGICDGDRIGNYVWECGKEGYILWNPKIGEYRSGSGDVFSAVISADVVNGVPFAAAVRKAATFITDAILESTRMDIPLTDGLAFEPVLWKLGTDFYSTKGESQP